MATALYGTMLVQPGNVEAIKRYLYSSTEIIQAAPIREYKEDGSVDTGRLVFLILRTEEITETEARNAQQYQSDRLASGMHGMTVGFGTRYLAQRHVEERASNNDWGLVPFGPFSVTSPDALV